MNGKAASIRLKAMPPAMNRTLSSPLLSQTRTAYSRKVHQALTRRGRCSLTGRAGAAGVLLVADVVIADRGSTGSSHRGPGAVCRLRFRDAMLQLVASL